MSTARRAVLVAVAGALCIATSATLVRLAAVEPATAAVFRCLYAVPFLATLAWIERRRFGPLSRRTRMLAWLSGIFFALDLVLWHHSIGYVGAGLATVLGNLQVFVVAFAAWWLLSERPSHRMMAAVPVVFGGVVLLSGLFDTGAYGSNPLLGVVFGLGTSLAYAAFLLILRQGSDDRRRLAGPLAHATAVAAVAAAALGPVTGGVNLAPQWPSHGWLLLLAITSQVVGWLLITWSLSRQPAALTSMLLLIQPMAAVVLSAAVLGERPSLLQLTGCAVIAAGVVYGSRAAPQDARAAAEQDPQVPKTSTV